MKFQQLDPDKPGRQLVDGFYWLDFGGRFVVAERQTTPDGQIYWYTPGTDDYFIGDNRVRVASGRLEPPETSTG